MPSFLERLTSAIFPRWGGDGWRSYGLVLPGSRLNYEAAAGDLWLNSVVALGLKWLGDRFPRPILRVSKIDAKGDYVPYDRHDMVDRWQQPNEFYTRRVMEQAIGLSLVVDGNAYVQKVRDGSGRVKELWYVPHQRMEPTWDKGGSEYIGGYMLEVDGRRYRLPREDVIHIRDGIDPDNERKGFSALRACLREVCTENEASAFTASLLRNSAVPGLMIVPDDAGLRPNDADAKSIKDKIRESFTGDNRGDTIVLKGKYRVQQVGYSPEQLRLDKLPQSAMAKLASATGVSLMTMGLPDPDKTYSNYETATRSSWGTVRSIQDVIREALRYQLLPDFKSDPRSNVVEYDYGEIEEFQESLDAVWTRVCNAYKSGVINKDEARELLSYDPVEKLKGEPIWYPGTGGAAGPEPDPMGQPGRPIGTPADSLNGNGDGKGQTDGRWRY